MSNTILHSSTLRQKAGLLLAFVLLLLGANIAIFERLRSELDGSVSVLATLTDVYRLSERIQQFSVLKAEGPDISRPDLDLFASQIDHDLQRLGSVEFSVGADARSGGELALSLDAFDKKWKGLRQEISDYVEASAAVITSHDVAKLRAAVDEVQGLIVDINFLHERQVHDRAGTLQRWMYLLAVVNLGLLWLAFSFFARQVVRPVERITEAASRVAHADFSARVDEVDGDNEVAQLGRVLNLATERVQALLGQLQSERDRLRKLQRAVDQSPSSVVITDCAGVIEYVNPGFTELTGYSPEEVIGRTPKLLGSGHTSGVTYKRIWSQLLSGQDWDGEILNRKKNGELFWEHMIVSPVFDDEQTITHFIAIKEDITARKRTENNLVRVNRALQVLSACSQALVHADTPDSLLDSICDNLVSVGGLSLAFVGMVDGDPAKAVCICACAGDEKHHAVSGQNAELLGGGVAGECIRQAQVLIARAGEPAFDEADDAEILRQYGLAARIALPLIYEGEVLGALCIYSADSESFVEDESKLLSQLADDMAYGLEVFRAREIGKAQMQELVIRERAMASTRNGIMITRVDKSADNPVVYLNHAFERMTGYSRAEIIGKNPRFLVERVADQSELDRLRDALRRGIGTELMLSNVRKDGSEYWSELSLSPIRDEQGELTHYVSIFNDVTDRVRHQEEFQHHVTHDPLTGLANRALLGDRIEQTVAHAVRSERKAAVLMIDLDRFKVINDSLGHHAGDALLREAAARLSNIIRSGDTLARVGGDEYVVVLAELGRNDEAKRIADEIIQALSEPYHLFGDEAFCGASVGISIAPDDGVVASALIKFAEVAMYTAKGLGGGGQSFYAHLMAQAAEDRRSIESDLRRAIEQGDLQLYFQPKIRARDYRLVGGEALIRWRHSERGMVPPMQFIPIAEETGLIIPVGDWVIECALGCIRQWLDAGLVVPPISVNLSPRQFRQHDLVGRVKRMVESAGVPPQLLELEVTERMIMQNASAVLGMLRELRDFGVRFSIDDFGTGYSSLSYLHQFPINTLKIDQSFVSELGESRDSRILTETIVMLSRNLGMDVVAEGVETMRQADVLQHVGCDVIQGFLFCQAVPSDAFAEILRAGFLMPKS